MVFNEIFHPLLSALLLSNFFIPPFSHYFSISLYIFVFFSLFLSHTISFSLSISLSLSQSLCSFLSLEKLNLTIIFIHDLSSMLRGGRVQCFEWDVNPLLSSSLSLSLSLSNNRSLCLLLSPTTPLLLSDKM